MVDVHSLAQNQLDTIKARCLSKDGTNDRRFATIFLGNVYEHAIASSSHRHSLLSAMKPLLHSEVIVSFLDIACLSKPTWDV